MVVPNRDNLPNLIFKGEIYKLRMSQRTTNGPFTSLCQHGIVYVAVLVGSFLSIAAFVICQLDFWLSEFSLFPDERYAAWMILGQGLMLTLMGAVVLYMHVDKVNKLAAYALQLESTNRDLDSFASIASHDLREPIRTIQSYAELLSRQEKFSQRGTKYMEVILEASRHAQEMLSHIRHYSRIGAGVDGHDEIVSMQTVFDQVKVNLAKLIEERNVTLSSSRLPQLAGSRIQLVQLVQNLIGNAIRYCPPERRPKVRFNARYMEDSWEFSVADNGEGIAEENREKIFQPFKRVSHIVAPGSGLGLSICRRIAEAHGGEIHCEENPQGGSLFIFTIREKHHA